MSQVGIAPGVQAVLSFSVLGHIGFAPASEDALPELLLPEAELPEALLPEALLPEALLPEALLPEALLPEALLPEAELPEALLVPDVPMPPLAALPEPPPLEASSELASPGGHVVVVLDEQPTPGATEASEATSATQKPVFMVPVNVGAERSWLRHSQRDARETPRRRGGAFAVRPSPFGVRAPAIAASASAFVVATFAIAARASAFVAGAFAIAARASAFAVGAFAIAARASAFVVGAFAIAARASAFVVGVFAIAARASAFAVGAFAIAARASPFVVGAFAIAARAFAFAVEAFAIAARPLAFADRWLLAKAGALLANATPPTPIDVRLDLKKRRLVPHKNEMPTLGARRHEERHVRTGGHRPFAWA